MKKNVAYPHFPNIDKETERVREKEKINDDI
jgi:hypothetical protein